MTSAEAVGVGTNDARILSLAHLSGFRYIFAPMVNHGLALLEDALRARKLDRTLTSAIPPGKGDGQVAPTALAGLDAGLFPTAHACAVGGPGAGGGLPRGQLSDMAGPQSSGRTTLLLQILAAATRRGEIAALIDTFDRLDLASVVAAGVDLDRLLWIRGHAISRSQGSSLGPQPRPQSRAWAAGLSLRPEALVDRTIERALKALNLVLQAGDFGVVVLDLADASPAALHRIPFTTWLRVQRMIEGSDTACVLVAPQPLARSAGGLTLALDGRMQWAGPPTSQASDSGLGLGAASSRSHRLAGLDVTVRVVSPRRRVDGEVMVAATSSR